MKKSLQSLYWLNYLGICSFLLLSACGQPTAQAADNNTPPNISGTPPTAAEVGIRYDFTPTASDPDGNRLRFEIEHRPKWASFDRNSGQITGIPKVTDVGTTRNIIIRVTDGRVSAFLPPFSITVSNPPASNNPPIISGSPATTVVENTPYMFSPTASDADGDALSFSILNKPGWASFSATSGALSGTPSAADVGTAMGITIRVSDGKATVSLPAFDITVLASTPANHAPSISGIPPTTVAQDTAYSFVPIANDPDGNNLVFSIINKPSWASFDSATGQIAGMPANSDVGVTNNIVISVSDGSLSASLPPFGIAVTNVNDAPIIGGTPVTSVQQDTVYTFTATASDPDGDALTFSISNKPTWASFNSLTGTLTGTPGIADIGSTNNIVISVSDGAISSSLPTFTITVTASPAISPTPRILYTDIVSGPNSGGENNNGAYLRVFGYNFGSASDLGSTTKVYVNDVEVAGYKGLRNAKAQPFMGQVVLQEIAVQVGTLGNPTLGTPLPIKVVHNGAPSNTDHSFTVQPGDMIYVALTGSDSTGDGSFANPYRLVQNSSRNNPAWSAFGPGDTIIMRGGAWNDTGFDNRFARFDQYRNGTAPNGVAGNGYYTIMAYPGEEVVVSLTYAAGNHKGAISGASSTYHAYNHYVAISSLTIHDDDASKPDRSGGGPINAQTSGEYWRVVNNEMTARVGQTEQRAAAITGGYRHAALLGNYIHDIQGATTRTTTGVENNTNHGVYIDNYSSGFELAYNNIENADGGSGIQFHGNLGSSCGYPDCDIATFSVHHNLLNGAAKHGMNYSWLVTSGSVHNNMIMNVALAGLRFASTDIKGLYVMHNTFFNINTTNNGNIGALQWEGSAADVNLYVENNIFSVSANSARFYLNYNGSGADAELTLRNNLWYGLAAAAPSKDSAPVAGDPLFVSIVPGAEDLRIQAGSPAIDTGMTLAVPLTEDFFFNSRINAPDVGAHEGG